MLGPSNGLPCLTCGGKDTETCPTHESSIESFYEDLLHVEDVEVVFRLMNGVVCHNCSKLLVRIDGKEGTGGQKTALDTDAGLYPAAPFVFRPDRQSEANALAKEHMFMLAPFCLAPEGGDARPLVVPEEIDALPPRGEVDEVILNRPPRWRNIVKNKLEYIFRRLAVDWYTSFNTGSKSNVPCTMEAHVCKANETCECTARVCGEACTCPSRFRTCQREHRASKERAALQYCNMQMEHHIRDLCRLKPIPALHPYDGQLANVYTFYEQKNVYVELFSSALKIKDKAKLDMSKLMNPKPTKKEPAPGSKARKLAETRHHERTIIVCNNYMDRVRSYIKIIDVHWSTSSIGANFYVKMSFAMCRAIENGIKRNRAPIRKAPTWVDQPVDQARRSLESVEQTRREARAQWYQHFLPRFREAEVAFKQIVAWIEEESATRIEAYRATDQFKKATTPRPLTKVLPRLRNSHDIIKDISRSAEALRKRIPKDVIVCCVTKGGCGWVQKPLKMSKSQWSFRILSIKAAPPKADGKPSTSVPPEYLLNQNHYLDNPQPRFGVGDAKTILTRLTPDSRKALGLEHVAIENVISETILVLPPSIRPSLWIGTSNITGASSDRSKPMQQDAITAQYRLISEVMSGIETNVDLLENEIGRPLLRGEINQNLPPSMYA